MNAHTPEDVRANWRRLAEADCRKSTPTKGAMQEALQQALAALYRAEVVVTRVEALYEEWGWLQGDERYEMYLQLREALRSTRDGQ